jgi:hypothetical protein
VDWKNSFTKNPLIPLPVKYSLLARKTTGLGHCSGKNIESEKDRWLLARMAAPEVGTFSTPRVQGLNKKRRSGPKMNVFKMKYVIITSSLGAKAQV